MAHVFSNKDGSLGTVVVVGNKNPVDFLDANEHTYHGDLEIPAHDYREALRYNNGRIIESSLVISDIKKKEVEERHDKLRLELADELKHADLDGKTAAEKRNIRDKASALEAHKQRVMDEIDGKVTAQELKLVKHLEFDHNGAGL